jgi:hypothetical protein
MVIAVSAAAADTAIAQGVPLTERTVWHTGDIKANTRAVVLGDIDGDGDLDLVCGNKGERPYEAAKNTAYKNIGEAFVLAPSWYSNHENVTLAVALGDIDGDGDLDLVCGNQGKRPAVYENTGTTFATVPVYVGPDGTSLYTNDVALADIDGDGDLDLVCGNGSFAGELDYVYANDGIGNFGDTPFWISGESRLTTAVAVGDLDGNGYLDLVCGSGDREPFRNVAYYNYGGTLDTSPSWRSAAARDTRDVALGDIDGNGHLDIVCGNNNDFNSLYLNDGTAIDTASSSSWPVAVSYNTRGIAIGDIDGDGYLDVAVGNTGALEDELVFLNRSGVLSATPDWDSWRPSTGGDPTAAIVLGDIEGDGDLDLVVGNDGESDKLYQNRSSYFTETPDWTGTNFSGNTKGVALGDIDGEGGLDLVAGNDSTFGQKNRLYLFENGTYVQGPWNPVLDDQTDDVILVDLDNNGDLDLVTAGQMKLEPTGDTTTSCYVYLNHGNGFPNDPSPAGGWGPLGSNFVSLEAACGRVDGDPFIDIVVYEGMYLNNGSGGFHPDPPAWWPADAADMNPRDILLLDVNDDEFLDVVRAGIDGKIQCFLGNDTTHFARYAGEVETGKNTRETAAGDVDGDGITDLLCVGWDSNVILYGNGTNFSSAPALFGYNPKENTNSIALGDLDADGDLDAVCANIGGGNSVYLGDGAVYADTAAWRWPAPLSSQDIAIADVDRDGDLDVVFGNDGANTLHLGRRVPVFQGDPLLPTNQRPNNAAHLRAVEVSPSGQNAYSIRFTVVDVESDPVWLVVEHSFRGSREWVPIGRFGHFLSSPSGVVDSIPWDVSTLPFSRQESVLRFRVLESPRSVSEFQYAPNYLYTYERIVPARAAIWTGADTLSFGTLTQGDTLSVGLPIANAGTLPLTIENIVPPSSEMRIATTTPFTLPPGQTDTAVVMLEPRTESGDIAGEIEIHSDDPLNAVETVYVTTDIRALKVTTRVMSAEPEVPPGEAVTVEVSPLDGVRVETATLFHRPSTSDEFSDSLLCGWSLDRFLVTIPGEFITEAGVDFYVRVKNSPVTSTDPDTAPAGWHHIDVAPPTGVTSKPRPDPDGRFPEYTPIVIVIEPDGGTVFVDGAAHFREGGTPDFETAPIVDDDGELTAVIPDTAVTARGVEYWVELNTATTTLIDPADPSASPHSIPVTVLNLQEPSSHPGMRYRLLSVPLSMEGTMTGALTDNLGSPEKKTQWRMFAHDGRPYVEVPNDTLYAFEHGRAYWLISKDGHRIDTGPTRGVTAPTDRPFEITLEPGHNLIGSPFSFVVAWDSVLVDTLLAADTLALTLVQPPVRWAGDHYDPVYATELEPFEGYWVNNLSSTPVTLKIPAVEAPPDIASDSEDVIAVEETSNANAKFWRLGISAVSREVRDRGSQLGVKQHANSEWDIHDRSKLPSPPGRYISVYFPHSDWDRFSGRYAFDIRGETTVLGNGSGSAPDGVNSGNVWCFDVAKNFSDGTAGDEVVIGFDGIDTIPSELHVYLVDRDIKRRVDLRDENGYSYFLAKRSFIATEDDARFVLLVGDDEFIADYDDELPGLPKQTALHQNYPNPFNPSTIIRYDLAQRGLVTLRVYDVTGALVIVLEDRVRAPGRYEVGWQGENAQGERLASGVYFYRLEAPGFTQTKKMVLLK